MSTEPPGPVNPAGPARTTGHLDAETLADHGEGLLRPDAVDAVETHLAGCPDCRELAAELRAVAGTLGALPAAVMPADVRTRIEGALAAEAGPVGASATRPSAAARTSVTTLPERRGGRRWTTAVAGWAAVVAVLVAGGALAVNLLSRPGSGSSGASTSTAAGRGTNAPAGTAAGPTTTVSNRDYTAHDLPAALAAIAAGKGTPVGATHDSARTLGSPSPGAPGPATANGSTTDSPAGDPFAALRTPAGLRACLDRLQLPALPLAVQLARFNHEPAAVVVVPDTSRQDRLAAYVVGVRCASSDDFTESLVKGPRH